MKLKYYPELDGIRAVAALMVMVFHFFQTLQTNDTVLLFIQKYAIIGQTGVSLFFVLSGFLITRILLESKNNDNYFSIFIVRRALRIFPLYFLYLIITYFIIPIILHEPFVSFQYSWYYWFYLQNFAMTFGWEHNGPGHFWSLAVEEHFYLFWPVIIYFLSSKWIPRAILIIVIGAFCLRIYFNTIDVSVFFFTFTRMDELAIGAALAVIELRENGISNILKSKLPFILLTLLIIFMGAVWFFAGADSALLPSTKYSALGLFYCTLIAVVITLKESSIIKNILKSSFFSFTGKISYGLYVYHPLCFLLYTEYLSTGKNVVIDFVLSFCMAYAISIISYYLYELRMIKLKKYFSY